MKKLFLNLLVLSTITACGNDQSAKAADNKTETAAVTTDSTTTGTISKMWCGVYQRGKDAGIKLDNGKNLVFTFCQGSSDIPGHILVEGQLMINPEAKDVLLEDKNGKTSINPKYLDRKAKISYKMSGGTRVISKIELLDSGNVESKPMTYDGSITWMQRKTTEAGYFLDFKKDSGETETLKLFDDKKGYTTVGTIFSGHGGPKKSDCVFYFEPGYILALMPENIKRHVKVTIEPKLMNSSNTEVAMFSNEKVITKIEFID